MLDPHLPQGPLYRAARALALMGGAVLVAVALLTLLSVTGRALADAGLPFGAIRGDFELVEAGTAVAVFSFLPLCQMRGGHVRVDLLAERFPAWLGGALGRLGDALLAGFAGVVCWRLWLGFGEKFPYGSSSLRDVLHLGTAPWSVQTTYELELPLWIPHALCLPGAALFTLAALRGVIFGAPHAREAV